MISNIIYIVIGLFIWLLVPGFFKSSSTVNMKTVNLVCTIIGLVVVIGGVIGLLCSIF